MKSSLRHACSLRPALALALILAVAAAKPAHALPSRSKNEDTEEDSKGAQNARRLARFVGGAVGTGVVVGGLGFGATALIPVAMTKFGAVALGVGSTHAPAAVGGVAANLQAFSAFCSGATVVKASFVGGTLSNLWGREEVLVQEKGLFWGHNTVKRKKGFLWGYS